MIFMGYVSFREGMFFLTRSLEGMIIQHDTEIRDFSALPGTLKRT